MSVEAFTWALWVPIGGNAKVVLLGLCNHAHPDGKESYPALDTLASYAHCDRSTARRNVRKLLDLRWIREDGHGPQGQNKYAMAMGDPFPEGGGKMPPVASEPGGGGILTPGGVAPMPPEPSLGTNQNSKKLESAREQVPVDFPDELRPHARAAFVVLRDVAAERGARAISARALAVIIMARPRKPIVLAAHDCAAWIIDHPHQPSRDVLARYRNWLDRTDDLAALEVLPGDVRALPDNVTRIRRSRMSARDAKADAREERQARREASVERMLDDHQTKEQRDDG